MLWCAVSTHSIKLTNAEFTLQSNTSLLRLRQYEPWRVSIKWQYQGTTTPIAKFMGPTWGPSGADRTQVGPCWPNESCYLGKYKHVCTRSLIIECQRAYKPSNSTHIAAIRLQRSQDIYGQYFDISMLEIMLKPTYNCDSKEISLGHNAAIVPGNFTL